MRNMGIVVVLSGAIASGKSTLAKGLRDRHGFSHFSSSSRLRELANLGVDADRAALQAFGEQLDNSNPGWIAEALARDIGKSDGFRIVVDAARQLEQIQAIRDALPIQHRVFHIHLDASEETLRSRYARRGEKTEFGQARAHSIESKVYELASSADLVIDTNRCTQQDTLARVSHWSGVMKRTEYRGVDVLIGGQYGSEGKGHVVAYLAPEYDALVRVGGPNAGHTVIWEGKKHSFYHLPSGTLHSPNAKIILGAGAVINVKTLLAEIEKAHVDPRRIIIDSQANIITQDDIDCETGLVGAVGSTGQGVGCATARKIMERGYGRLMARDIPELQQFIGDTVEYLDSCYLREDRIMLEGTQGTGLSLHHGPYPYVTSRDTTAGGCMAESGIPASRIRKVIMTTRTNPIRVASPQGGTSGPMSNELTWEQVAERSGEQPDVLREREKTTTTKRQRRVSEFDWSLFTRSVSLNGPTDIALTFADYLSPKNQDARRFEQLTEETRDLVQEIEQVAACPVSLITTRFHERSIIDRRTW